MTTTNNIQLSYYDDTGLDEEVIYIEKYRPKDSGTTSKESTTLT